METNKKEEVELITKEQVDHVVETLTKAEEHAGKEEANESKIDFEKSKEVLRSLEGASIQTVITILSTTLLLLPLGAIATVLDMGKSVSRIKAMSALFKVFGDAGCPDCKKKGCEECVDSKDSEGPSTETKE